MDNSEQNLRNEYEVLQKRLQEPAIFSSKDYSTLARRQAELEKILSVYDEISKATRQRDDAQNLAKSGDEEMSELAKNETERLDKYIKTLQEELQEFLLPKDPNDERDCIVEIRAAAGGD